MNDTTAASNNKEVRFMAKLTIARRRALPDSAFADPAHRKYPDFDKGHAQAAAGRAAQHHASPKVKKKIGSKLHPTRSGVGMKQPKFDKVANEYVK